MALTRLMTLSTPWAYDTYHSLSKFRLHGFVFDDDHLNIYVHPQPTPPIVVYPNGSGITEAKALIQLNAAATTKLTDLIVAIEDKLKSNLEA